MANVIQMPEGTASFHFHFTVFGLVILAVFLHHCHCPWSCAHLSQVVIHQECSEMYSLLKRKSDLSDIYVLHNI